MTTLLESGLPLLGLLVIGSCAGMRAPVESTGPAASREGVRLTLVGQNCTQSQDTDSPGSDLVEIQVAVQVQNPTGHPVTVHRDGFALATEGAEGLRPQSWGAPEPVAVNPGQTSEFKLRFSARGLSCSKQMVLGSGSAIETASGPLAIPDVRFLPSRPR